MKILLWILCLLTLDCFAGAQVNNRADNISQLQYLMDSALAKKDTMALSMRVSSKLDTSARGEVNTGTKATVATKRGVLRCDTFTIPANGIVDLQSYLTTNGFTSMKLIGLVPYRQPGGASNAAQIYISDWSPTSITLNVTVQNTAVVQILGINVLSGLPLVAPAAGTVKAYLSFVAY